ncbi:MAG: hypothetical protein HS130_08875 [Deltaproteobacteria bacterium]|nr:hypothetical protein [Deltaproteobacteria bacterium]
MNQYTKIRHNLSHRKEKHQLSPATKPKHKKIAAQQNITFEKQKFKNKEKTQTHAKKPQKTPTKSQNHQTKHQNSKTTTLHQKIKTPAK